MSSFCPPLLLLLPPPPPPLSSPPPHAVTPKASAATRQPEAAIQRDLKEPLLIRVINCGRASYPAPASLAKQRGRRWSGMPFHGEPRGAVLVPAGFVARQERRDDVRGRGDQDHDDRDHERVEGLDSRRPEDDPHDETGDKGEEEAHAPRRLPPQAFGQRGHERPH